MEMIEVVLLGSGLYIEIGSTFGGIGIHQALEYDHVVDSIHSGDLLPVHYVADIHSREEVLQYLKPSKVNEVEWVSCLTQWLHHLGCELQLPRPLQVGCQEIERHWRTIMVVGHDLV
jgi:hypothetical protein